MRSHELPEENRAMVVALGDPSAGWEYGRDWSRCCVDFVPKDPVE